MIKYTVPTSGKRLTVDVTVFSEKPIDLIIGGRDMFKHNTVYFKREVNNFKGQKTFEIPMPITPDKLSLLIYDKNKANSKEVNVSGIKMSHLDFKLTPKFDTDLDKEFYVFMFWFCENFKYLPLGMYYSENKNYSIDYSNYIFEMDGAVSTTPSRINRSTCEIEVSRDKCKHMTVYMLAMILLHEYFHYRLSTPNEQIVDNNAMVMYKNMGFPSTEALYSFIKGFEPKTNEHADALIQRTDNLFRFLQIQTK